MTATTDPIEAANLVAKNLYRRLAAGGDLHRKVSDLLVEIGTEAMLEIGAKTNSGDLDPEAEALFGDYSVAQTQLDQEIVEHVYRATRLYLERKALTPA